MGRDLEHMPLCKFEGAPRRLPARPDCHRRSHAKRANVDGRPDKIWQPFQSIGEAIVDDGPSMATRRFMAEWINRDRDSTVKLLV